MSSEGSSNSPVPKEAAPPVEDSPNKMDVAEDVEEEADNDETINAEINDIAQKNDAKETPVDETTTTTTTTATSSAPTVKKTSKKSKKSVKSKCKLCNGVYTGNDHAALTKHIYARHTDVSNECRYCRNTYADKKGLCRHILHVHLAYRPYPCTRCTKAFGRRDLLRKHEEQHALGLIRATAAVRSRNVQTRNHHHRLATAAVLQTGVSGPGGGGGGGVNCRHLCTQCGKGFIKRENMLKHVEICVQGTVKSDGGTKLDANGVDIIQNQCVICDEAYDHSTDTALTKHLYAKHMDTLSCVKCGQAYSDKKGLCRHILHVHFNYRPYKCTACFKSFARKDHYRSHCRLHHENMVTLYDCENCDKYFVKQEGLKRHQQTCKPNEGKINVERILDKREVNGRVEYLIKWEGFAVEESTWEQEECITGVRREDTDCDEDNTENKLHQNGVAPDSIDGSEDEYDYLDDLDVSNLSHTIYQ